MANREESVRHFLNLIKRSQRGAFKIYIGMIAGVGKTYKMLQEAHEMSQCKNQHYPLPDPLPPLNK